MRLDSQRKLNCALSPQTERFGDDPAIWKQVAVVLSIFFEHKDLDRQTLDGGAAANGSGYNIEAMKSQIANFRFPSREPSRF
jgi:hypothetical protein